MIAFISDTRILRFQDQSPPIKERLGEPDCNTIVRVCNFPLIHHNGFRLLIHVRKHWKKRLMSANQT
ncbi:MAG: hypothetical protein LPK90_08700, partial [Alphaproteobacteria bacterium]|nr:hypothetical protein [Alphaproteobacteria bacterium]MDX5493665.1 hypothetical protein [Alphaproteobacteria bacterium]